jgi:CBS domain-containing protein/uncharacterized protein (DUF2267 family)
MLAHQTVRFGESPSEGASMSLDRYVTHKVVIMHPMATTHEAARAMARHQIGAVLVGEHGRVEGIVTDRDLAVSVVGTGADPKKTTVDEVMSYVVETVDVNDTVDDVIDAMLDAGCRRVPITKDGRVVGIVTVDDLVADGTITAERLGPIVRTQLELASLFVVDSEADSHSFDREQRARLRHERRVENSFARMVHMLQAQTGLATRERAAVALQMVLSAICRRLAPNDAKHLIAQLPFYLRLALAGETVGPDRTVNATSVTDRLARGLNIDLVHAEGVLCAIGNVVATSISKGEARLLRVHLSAELRDIFPERQPQAAAQGA